MRVLLIEDDEILGSAIRDHIAGAGNGVDWMRQLDDAGLAMDTASYELVLLDLGLPDGRGLDFLRQLRKRGSEVPVMIVTAEDQIAVRIDGLNSGADDYLVKPFDLNELGARIAAVARRYTGKPNPTVAIGEVVIDLASKSALKTGTKVVLTAREWAILGRLLQRPGSVVAKSDLEDSLYAFGMEVESNAVEVHVSRIRKKLGHEFIKTLRGTGYSVGE